MNKGLLERVDLILIIVTLAVIVCGLIAIFSATYTSGTDYFSKQLIFAITGIVMMIFISYIPPRHIAKASYILYFISLVLLVLVLFFGKKISGSKSWFSIGSFGIQPSEFAKIATVLALANFLSKSEEGFRNINRLPDFLKACAIVLIPVALIMRQPDMGTSLVFVSMILPVLFWAGLSPFALFCILSPVIAVIGAFLGVNYFIGSLVIIGIILLMFKRNILLSAGALIINIIIGYSVDTLYDKLMPYQQARIKAVFNPETDPLGSGYNVIQSKVAIGSGGLTGKGFLQGTQTQLKFIPEQWTDFIYCMIGEEFGFIGSVTILILYMVIILKLVTNANITRNNFLSAACIGFASIILFHLVINVGMTIGIMPVIGIPLPMMSYGISSLISFLVMIGIGMSAYRYRNQY
ncbi:MAG TPA: rod shape-determining protein RodA [Ignavibacteria bacterium]|nr:rod shape-determining protein RodA [Bacteroidota bacterium]HRI85922.1 rod shape-determining protein RodA [Ignavibacteria bacterium]HRJ98946.1 rod shape-determining protein RodA [Ignavibacteria bacterium]